MEAALLTADISAARTALIEAEAAWKALGNYRQAGLALAMLGRPPAIGYPGL